MVISPLLTASHYRCVKITASFGRFCSNALRIADIGYNATKQKYYYGFKVHVVTDTQGLILNYDSSLNS